MKVVLVCTLFVVAATAEPPVDNRYLPPQQGFRTTNQESFSPPSQSYGAPGGSQRQGAPSSQYGPPGAVGFGPQRQTDAVFRGRPSSNYGPPVQASRPSQQYGPPNRNGNGGLSRQYGPPQRQQNAPSTQYGTPSQSNSFGAPSQQYGTPSFGAPSQQYGARSQAGPSQQNRASSFGGSTRGQLGGFSGSSPSPVYGAPEASREYLPPGASRRSGGYGGDEEGNGEPANYSFEYMVKDEESGNDFGHRESRMGDRAEGLYYVLLPDGRKQTVEYEADQDGYRPKISYEDTGAGAGYNRNAQGLSQNGYQGSQNGYTSDQNGYQGGQNGYSGGQNGYQY